METTPRSNPSITDSTVWVDSNLLESFIADVFMKCQVPAEDAKIAAEVLITSDLRGIDSHGISRLKPIYYDRLQDEVIVPELRFEIVRESPTTAVVDAHHGLGHVVGKRAMEIAIDKARAYGMGMVAVRNSTHYGIAGYYAMMAAAAGMIGVTGTNARPSVAPTFGAQNMLGTNPLVFGMPTDEPFPFLLDCATSTAQRGKIEVYERHGRDLPEGWVVGADGQYCTDPHQVLEDFGRGLAALTPIGGKGEQMGGHKGYGYSTVVELLSAALQGGSFLWGLAGMENGQPVFHRLGHFFMAINVENFTSLSEFKQTAGSILRDLRASKKAEGHDRIYTAGEKEYYTTLERQKKGIPLDKSIQEELLFLKEELGLDQYQFPF